MSLVIEIRTSIKLLRNGLAEIQKISGANDFYHPALLFLSNGLERLLKSMLCLNYQNRTGKLPTRKQLLGKKNGHDISFLKQEVEKIVVPIEKPFAANDYELLTSDELINRICGTLSEYGKQGRYFNMDAILGTTQEYDVQNEWERIETFALKQYLGEKMYIELLGNPEELEYLYETSNMLLVLKLESFFRALTRQFLFGNFSSSSKRFLFEIQDFSDIEDEQLGKTSYGQFKNHEWVKRQNRK